MKKISNLLHVVTLVAVFSSIAQSQTVSKSHGIDYPIGWQNWSTIAVSHRTDNNTLRVILGNNIAIKASRSGDVNPWTDGAILGKVVWKDTQAEDWEAATVPAKFVHAEFMFKDSKKYVKSYGWGWARWVGLEQKPFEKGMKVCIDCHTPVKGKDWVFTKPALFPK